MIDGETNGDGSGLRAYLFTDVVDSVRHWAADGDAMSSSLRQHDRLLLHAIAQKGGTVFSTAGDSFGAAFELASDAVDAALRIQQELKALAWEGPPLRVRAGIHVGEAVLRDDNFFGPAVNLAARLSATAHAGQLVISRVVADLVNHETQDLGSHRLRGIDAEVNVLQVGVGDFPPIRSMPALSTVPTPRSTLVGRIDDARTVRKLLSRHRHVTLTGPGGCGKTRLAIEVAAQEADEAPDRAVRFVALVGATDAAEVPAAFVDAMGLTMSSLQSPVDQIVHFLGSNETLLVVDNCEHVVDAAADLIDQLLSRVYGLRILATSQEALELDGEAVWRVPQLETGSGSEASRLFIERALAVAPELIVDDFEQLNLIAEICRRLEGAPLAIELAAARVRTHSLREIHDRLDERLALLGSSRRRTHGRHQTLAAAVSWSWNLLDEDEQRFLRALSVFQGGFDAADTYAVAGTSEGEALVLLDALLGKSLVDRYAADDGSVRFRLLETIRLFVAELRNDAGETRMLRDRHLDHFVAEQATLGESSGYDLVGDWRRMREFANLRAAIAHAVETERPGAAVDLAARLVEPFGRRGEAAQCLEWLGLRDQVDDDELRCLALATSGYLRFAAMMGTDGALADLGEAIDLANGRPMPGVPLAYVFSASVRVWSDPPEQVFALVAEGRDMAARGRQPAIDNALVSVVESNLELALNRPHAVPERNRQAIAAAPGFGLRSVLEAELAIALLCLDEVDEAASVVANFCEVSPATSWGYFTELTRVAVQARSESTNAAGRAWIPVAQQIIAERPPLTGDCLQLFAWLHWLDGNHDRAREITDEVMGMQTAPTMAPVVIKGMHDWSHAEYEQWFQAKAERLADIDKLLRSFEVMPRLLDEEYARWS